MNLNEGLLQKKYTQPKMSLKPLSEKDIMDGSDVDVDISDLFGQTQE